VPTHTMTPKPKTNYNDFKAAQKKENDVAAQRNIHNFYKTYFKGFTPIRIDYDAPYGKLLQSAGVDTALIKENYYGSINEQIWIQEKVTFKQYSSLMFEYEKKSGKQGWAIEPHEQADYLLYYCAGEIHFMNFPILREFLTDNLEDFKQRFRVDTDNKNICVPIEMLRVSLNLYNQKQLNFMTISEEAVKEQLSKAQENNQIYNN
jgi:hypothetical protein